MAKIELMEFVREVMDEFERRKGFEASMQDAFGVIDSTFDFEDAPHLRFEKSELTRYAETAGSEIVWSSMSSFEYSRWGEAKIGGVVFLCFDKDDPDDKPVKLDGDAE